MRQELVDLVCELIRFQTIVFTGDQYREYTDYFSGKLEQLGLEVQKIDVPEEKLLSVWGKELEKSRKYIAVRKVSPRIIVLAKWPGLVGHPKLHLWTHYDVTEGRGNSFEPSVKDGKIFGKGASDPRSGTACVLMALKALRKAGIVLNGDIFVSAVPDADLGGDTGTGYLVEKGYGKSDMVITSYMGGPDTVLIGYKGDIWWEITTYGKKAHTSEPHLGINPIEKMMKIQSAILALDQKYRGVRSKWNILPPESARPTITIARIFTEGHFIPDRCVMHVNRRLIPEETVENAHEDLMEQIRRLQNEDPDLNVEVEQAHVVENPVTPPDNPLVQTLVKNIKGTLNVEAKIALRAYYTDSRFFATKWNVPTVNYGPGPGFYYSPGENVAIQDLISATKVMALTIIDLLQ
jgi:succinyl-diaminopimelate desuccinylase